MRHKNRITYFTTIIATLLVYCSGYAAETLPERGICAHRGANTLAPENTIPALVEAHRLGAAMIEFDVRLTKDRQLVLLHDWTVDRTSNGSGNITDLTFDEVRSLDFGAWKGEQFAGTPIPTLDEALAVLPRDVWLNVHCGAPKNFEIFEAELGRAVAEKLVADGRENQAFIACSQKMAERISEKYPQILICNMERQTNGDDYIDSTIARRCAFIQLTGGHPTPERVARLKAAGVKINYFGSNDAAEIQTLFDLGVDFPLVDNLPLGQKAFIEWNGGQKDGKN